MAKVRKYTRWSESAAAYECSKRSCKWQGTQEQQALKQFEAGYKESVCPNCGNNEFYGIRQEYIDNGTSNQATEN